jgi:hypothetical protein
MLAFKKCKHNIISWCKHGAKKMAEDDVPGGRARGGRARRDALSPERRKEIASKAASARWDGNLPVAEHEGDFPLGTSQVSSAVLGNGTRIITQATFLRALGRSRSPKAGTGVLSTVDELPFFLQADVLKPFISDDLLQSTTPIFYRTKSGGKGVGYDARLLPMVAEVYLRFRDSELKERKTVPARYERMIVASDILIRALANVGIIALVDEATGFQNFRTQDALSRILNEYIAKELQPYIPTFPAKYYQEMFRLRGLDYPKDTVKRPQYFGILTNDIVYRRIAPGVLEELKAVTPKLASGRLSAKLFQRLTRTRGYPKLREHLGAVVAYMELSEDWHDFMRKLNRFKPKFELPKGHVAGQLSFDYDSKDDSGKGL